MRARAIALFALALSACSPSTFAKAVRYSAKLQNELCEATGDALLAMAVADHSRIDELAADNAVLAEACSTARDAHAALKRAAVDIARIQQVTK